MKAVFAEKPDVARHIAQVLGATNRGNNTLEGNGWIVCWAAGHLFEQQKPEQINPAWAEWSPANLPMIPTHWPMRLRDERDATFTASLFRAIKRAFTDPRVEAVVNAGDAGREGEHIFRIVYTQTGSKKPVLRAWFRSLTPAGIKEAFDNLRPGNEYDALAAAAEARSRADWLVGMNATRAYTCAARRGPGRAGLLAIGRVQTPALAMIVAREEEIRGHRVLTYYEVLTRFRAPSGEEYEARWFDPHAPTATRTRLTRAEDAASIASACAGRAGEVIEWRADRRRENAPRLPDLGELQRTANRHWGYTLKETLEAVQALYEKHRAVTYPRTDCQSIGSDLVPQLPDVLRGISSHYPNESDQALFRLSQSGGVIGKPWVDDTDAAKHDHHAIVPTGTVPQGLAERESNVYDLICRRFLAIFYPPHEYEARHAVTRVVDAAGREHLYTSSGRLVLADGWKAVLASISSPASHKAEDGDHDDPGATHPLLARGDQVHALQARQAERQTRPRPRYTDETIVAAMEHAGRDVDNTDYADAMRERGLGTPATRASILETLIQRNYLLRKRKELVPTDAGIHLIAQVQPELKSPEMTGEWECTLKRIERGEEDAGRFLDGIVQFTHEIVSRTITHTPEAAAQTVPLQDIAMSTGGPSRGRCPACGKGEIVPKSAFYGCTMWRKGGQGCDFKIWRSFCEAEITPDDCALLLSGRVTTEKAMRGKHGAFRARLRFNQQTMRVEPVRGDGGGGKEGRQTHRADHVCADTPGSGHATTPDLFPAPPRHRQFAGSQSAARKCHQRNGNGRRAPLLVITSVKGG